MVAMTPGEPPERARDADVPEHVRVLLWLTSKAGAVLHEAADAGARLDAASDRDRLAMSVVRAVLRELTDQGNTLHLLPPPAQASEASDDALDHLVAALLTAPHDPDPQEDLHAAIQTWFTFLEGRLGQMSDREKLMLGVCYGVGTNAAENNDRLVARHHLERLKKQAERWRDDADWPGRNAPRGG
jgi:hypothetical protein